MLEFLKRRLKSQKGAMDKVIVTLLFVVIGVGAVVGINKWVDDKKDDLILKANAEYTNAVK
ncbi:hypothetical protein ACMC56_02095 [Campylobacterota bacterium DY0563]